MVRLFLYAAHLAFVFLFVCISFVPETWAGSAYKRWVTNSPLSQSWQAGLTITMQTDVERCKRSYGDRWPSECEAPNPGRIGQIVDGVTMTPREPGQWRWVSETTMRFTPKTHLTPQTRYTISLDGVELSKRIVCAPSLIYETPPQAVNIARETVWIDPSSKGKHMLSIPLTFLWPVDTAQMEKAFSLQLPKGQPQLRLGKPQFVWTSGKDQAVVNIPILGLPTTNSFVLARLTDVIGWHYEKGSKVLDARPKGRSITQSQVQIVGTDKVMDVRNIKIVPGYNEGLSRQYKLVVTTSLQTRPRDVLEKLDIFLLPQKISETSGRNCDWERMPAVSAKDLAASKKLEATLLQPADEPATEIELQLPLEAGRGLLCAMKTGLASTGGMTLNRVRRFIRTVPTLNPEVHFVQPGNILALREGQKLDLHSVGVERIEWMAERVRDPFLALLAARSNFTDIDDEVDFDTLSDVHKGTVTLAKKPEGTATYTSLDLSTLEGQKKTQRALLRITVKGYVGKVEKCQEQKLLLISDLALLLKTAADGTHHVFVRHFSTEKPAKGCMVLLLGANGAPVVSGRTDEEGRCDLPSTYGMQQEKRPTALVVRSGDDLAWLSLKDDSREVEYSDFKVAGRHASGQGLVASVFSERGIYLPGETIPFGCIVTQAGWKPLDSALPIIAQLYDPTGHRVWKQKVSLTKTGQASIKFTSAPDCPTGTYQLDLTLAQDDEATVLGSCKVRVEEFQPDTLALRLALEGTDPDGWIYVGPGTEAQVRVSLKNLYGEPAAKNRIRARFLTTPEALHFAGFREFTFAETTSGTETEEIALPDTSTDAKGEALLNLPLESMAMGSRRGTLVVEGFEKSGGRAVVRSYVKLFSPRKHILGYKPEGEANTLDYLQEGSKAQLRFLLLDNTLAPAEMGVTVAVSARRYVTSLVRDSQGYYRYDATPVDTEFARETVQLSASGTLWSIPVAKAGDYLITVTDAEGSVLASIPYSVAGNRLAEPGEEPVLARGALRLKVDQKSYQAGGTVQFRISAPFAGTGLVTLERERVFAHAWFSAEPGESVHTLTIPKNFEGKGYLNVSFVRAQSSSAIYMQPHAYAVEPIEVRVHEREMGLKLQASEQVLPGQTLKVRVQSTLPGTVQLFAVDEGVLQLTNFKTPDPRADLLLDRALDVTTRHALHLLMPDHERILGRIPGFGGGMGNGGGRFLNPFRRKNEPPFAFWSELLSINGETTVEIPVPSYFSGSMRIMAVGSGINNQNTVAFGATKTTAKVRGEILLKPNLPLVVCPGDTFEGGVVVANTVSGSGAKANVALELLLPNGLTLVQGKTQQQLAVPENEERALTFRVQAKDTLGNAEIRFEARLVGAEKVVERAQSLSVRPPQPKLLTEKVVPLTNLAGANGSYVLEPTRTLYPYLASTQATLAATPILALRALAQRLDQYPYGCTEQRISMAIPWVVLQDHAQLRDRVFATAKRNQKENRKHWQRKVEDAIAAIRASLNYDGVSQWPGGDANLFMTAYACDFLVTMREHGLGMPEDLAERLFSILENAVTRTPANVADGRIKIYAAWILQRDGRIMTSVLTNLEDWFAKNTKNWERDVLASLLAEGFVTLRLKKRGIQRLPQNDVQPTNDLFFSNGMAHALHAMIVEESFGEERDGMILMEKLVDQAFLPNATTVDQAMISRALVSLGRRIEKEAQGTIRCTQFASGFSGQVQEGDGLPSLDAPGCQRFALQTAADARDIAVLLTEDGFDRTPTTTTQKAELEVTRSLRSADGTKVTRVALGDVVVSQVCARSFGKSRTNVVLTDLNAGGLEPLLDAQTEEMAGLMRVEHREDRSLYFVDLTTEERCFTTQLRATTRGHFVLPSVQAEAMYAPEISASGGSGSVDVE